MRILIISHLFPSRVRPSMGTFVFQQAEALIKQGHSIIVVSPSPWIPKWIRIKTSRWKDIQNLPKFEEFEGIKVFFVKCFVIPKILVRLRGRFYYIFLFLFFNSLYRKEKFDIIHCHSVLPDGDLGKSVKKKFKKPLIITIHGTDLLKFAQKRNNRIRIKRVLQAADGIGVVSTTLKNLLFSKIAAEKILPPVEIIYNGIKIYKKYSTANWFGHDSAFKILSIGMLIQRKNYGLVFEALRTLKHKCTNLKYFIIGEGWDRDYFVNQVKEMDLNDDVFFIGAVSHKQAMSYLREADLFVLPSVKESFGVVYLESMYFNKITIASRGEGIKDIIKDGENGFLVNPDDPAELTNLLNEIISKINKYKHIGKNAHETVWPLFNWDNNAKAYHSLYKRSLAKNV